MSKKELKHHGVIGMKWGRRKQLRPMSEDAKKAKDLKKKKVSKEELDELKTLIDDLDKNN